MGITGILPLMKPAIHKVNLKSLKGTVAAVDTNGWIHKACFYCGDKVYMNEETDRYIRYVIDYCAILKSFEITPLLVFDGQALPAKSETKLARQKRKQAVRDEIEVLLRQGREKEARNKMRTCVDVTFPMVKRVIDACRTEGIDYIVAPFEADSQIAFLVKSGVADYAITEDSDLLVFGCPRSLYKLDKDSGVGQMLELSKLNKCFKFDFRKFQLMCILSGCDYLSNVPGIAITRAVRYFESLGQTKIDEKALKTDRVYLEKLLCRIPIALKLKATTVPQTYIDGYIRALNTFEHQVVYCPMTKKLRHLKPPVCDILQQPLTEYAGHFFDEICNLPPEGSRFSFAELYAMGNVDTKTSVVNDTWEGPEESGKRWFAKLVAERIKMAALKVAKVVEEEEEIQFEVVEDEVILLKDDGSETRTKSMTTTSSSSKITKVDGVEEVSQKRVYGESRSLTLTRKNTRQATSDSENKLTEATNKDFVHTFNPYGGRKVWSDMSKKDEEAVGSKKLISKYFGQRKRKRDSDKLDEEEKDSDEVLVIEERVGKKTMKKLSVQN